MAAGKLIIGDQSNIGTEILPSALTVGAANNILGGSNNQVLISNGTQGVWSNAPWTSNTGTVTSITITQGNGITVTDSGTEITTSGTRTISIKASANGGIGVDANGVYVENPVPGHAAEDGTYLIWNGSSTAWGSLP